MEELIKDWGYIALFLYSFGGGFVGLVIAGILSYSGELNIIISILVAGVSNFLGDQFLFTLARNNKHQAKQMMQKHRRKIALSHLLMKKYGTWVIFIQKYIYGIKTLIPLAMGLTKYDYKKFLFFNVLATVLWSCIIGMAAYTLGELVYTYIEELKSYAFILIAAVVIAIIYFFRKMEKR